MEVIVDGQRNFAVSGEAKDGFAVAAAVNDYLVENGRAMQMLIVDGQPIVPEEMLEALEGRGIESITTFEVKSDDVDSMVERCLKELQEATPELPVACRRLSEIFQGETPEDGFEPFQELANIWGHIKRREQLVATALDIDLSTCSVSGAPFTETQRELVGFLEEAAAAIERGDTVLLGDLLEYELAPRAEQELAIVALLQQQALARQSA